MAEEKVGSILVVSDDPKEKLVGGLFGLVLPNYLTIESMFTIESGSSKAALLYLEQLCLEIGIEAIDAQDYYEHLASLGAKRLTAKQFETERKRYSPIPSEFFSCGERMMTSALVVARKKDSREQSV
jgi:Leu/Phe-tRNA-protein transferase